jgi:hypothetical protein
MNWFAFCIFELCVEWFVLDGLECDVTNNVELSMLYVLVSISTCH